MAQAIWFANDCGLGLKNQVQAEKGAHEKFGDRMHQKEWFRVAWSDVAAWMDSSSVKRRVPDPSINA